MMVLYLCLFLKFGSAVTDGFQGILKVTTSSTSGSLNYNFCTEYGIIARDDQQGFKCMIYMHWFSKSIIFYNDQKKVQEAVHTHMEQIRILRVLPFGHVYFPTLCHNTVKRYFCLCISQNIRLVNYIDVIILVRQDK